MEWLDGFEMHSGTLVARLVTNAGIRFEDNLGTLAKTGVPDGDYEWRAPFTTDFADWGSAPTADYLTAFPRLAETSTNGSHQIFRFRHGWSDFLVPALVLFRALFPLIPEAFEYAFTPRMLELLCQPIENEGHWSVVMPDFTGVYRGRNRPATRESLTWCSLFPSANKAWSSVYKNCCQGVFAMSLPLAQARILPIGIRRGRTVHVTSLSISAVLALEPPFDFASGAANSFLWNRSASPLGPHTNQYQESAIHRRTAPYTRLTDAEWARVRHVCEPAQSLTGRKPRDCRRTIADGLLQRYVTGSPWKEIAQIPLTPSSLEEHWYRWRREGRFEALLQLIKDIRPHMMDMQSKSK
ncbi:MAG: transposase [Ruthenibacterium sp.]